MRKRTEVVSVLGLAMPRTPVIIDVESVLRDDQPYRGVSYHPGKRKWRAYLYSGRKQVAHRWCDTKASAIAARREMEIEHGKPGVMRDGSGRVLSPFPRTVLAPKEFDLQEILLLVALQCNAVKAYATQGRQIGLNARQFGNVPLRRHFGRRIGRLLAVVDLLGMAGQISAAHVEEGMRAMAEELGRGLE